MSWLQANASDPQAINQGWRHDAGNVLYTSARQIAGAEAEHAYHEHIDQVSRTALRVAENNPGNRVLVVTNIQYCHHIRPQLRQKVGIVETT